ncbi:Hsp90 ATPase activator [Encephalitozoon intestinalis ATCC 50506]|uniref:Hsp90 ATPase activator n=1 Tax=Encephalitozoon intestinalis (strain ATCC 50506) TaxID=876142 RepID=E0S854_ENCIT|nr:Hsp90 ATPase activator [Encephalitozoon intestinalis ATCC 50506]ADM11889.1 Hsp90 ATPase activator [Encephalitozoon intestinalis ATCC 50506]UTX45645.1 hypothetical protein GPK93_07g12100 [Encephalitozoon intestinalis]
MESKGSNYHWAESDLSGWAKDKIKETLEHRGYKVNEMDVMVKICQRMNTLGLVYMIGFECTKDGKYCSIRNFYSVSEKAEGMEDFEWFPGFFSELEEEAILKFGSRVLDTNRQVEERKPCVRSIDAEDAKTVDISYKASINCEINEFKNFILSQEYISMWSGYRATFDGDDILIDGVIIRRLREENGCIRMEWKLERWSHFTEVKISLESFLNSSKVTVKQKAVPIKEEKSIRMWWHEKVFASISTCFGFILKPLE